MCCQQLAGSSGAPGRLRSPASASRAPGFGYDAARLGLRCGPRLAPADHHRRLPAEDIPLTPAFQIASVGFRYAAQPPTSLRSSAWHARFTSPPIPSLSPPRQGTSLSRCARPPPADRPAVGRCPCGNTYRRAHDSVRHPPQFQFGFASVLWSPWHVGLLHFPPPQELLCPKPPQAPHPLAQDPGALGTPPAPAHPPFAGAPTRRPGSLDITASCGQGKLRDRSPPLRGSTGPRARPGQGSCARPSGSPHATAPAGQSAPPPSAIGGG